MIIDSFFAKLGFDVNTEGLADFRSQADALKKSVMEVGAVFIGATVGLGLLVEKVAGSMAEIQDFAELNELSAKSVAALGKIATENDSSLDGLKTTLQNLNRGAGEAALGVGRSAIIFKKLGIEAKNADGSVKKADQLLGEIADKMQGISRQEQIALAGKLGIDPPLVKLLEEGSENLAKLREEAELFNPFTEGDYQLAEKVDKLFAKAKGTVGVFAKMIGVSLLPIAKEVLTTYLEWFKASRKATSGAVVDGLKIFVAFLSTAWDWVRRLVGGVRDLYDWLTKFRIVTYAAGAALAVFVSAQVYEKLVQLGSAIKLLTLRVATFNATALIIPAIFGAIAIAIGLLIDDYVNFTEGNESFIGDMAARFPVILDIINGIKTAVGAFVGFWQHQWENLGPPVMGLIESIGALAVALWPIARIVLQVLGWAFLNVLPIAVFVLRGILTTVTVVAEGITVVLGGIIEVVSWVVDKITALFSMGWGNWVAGFHALGDGIISIFTAVFGWIMRGIDAVSNTIGAAVSGVARFLGLSSATPGASGAPTGPLAQAIAAAPTMPAQLPTAPWAQPGGAFAPTAPLGAAANTPGGTSVSASTTITGTNINITAPDAQAAGESVRRVLEDMNRQTTRNGQSMVDL